MPTFRQFLITKPGARHLRQEGNGDFVHYVTGMEISLSERDAPNGTPDQKWSNLGLRLVVGTPTTAPKVPISAETSSSKFADLPPKKTGEIDPVTGAEIPARDGPDLVPTAEELAAAEAKSADVVKRAKIETLLQAGEKTNGAQEFNAWRASVIESGVIEGDVPTQKAALMNQLAQMVADKTKTED